MKTIILMCIVLLSACTTQKPKEVTNFTMPVIHNVTDENKLEIKGFSPHPETLKKIEVSTDKFKYNKDYHLRDSIVGIEFDWTNKQNDIAYFANLDVRTLEKLITNDFIDPNDAQNEAPDVRDIFKFMSNYPQVLASGYLVGPNRDDYRISIDGLKVPNKYVSAEVKSQFLKFCSNADELDKDHDLMSWWD